MMLSGCPREREVKELVGQGQWPVAAATRPELAAHLRECRACADLALVTDAFQRARANAAGPRKMDAPGLLWWQAQLRRREAAMERIAKPILGAQIFALAVNLVVAAGFIAWQVTQGTDWLSRFGLTRRPREVGAMMAAAFSGWGLMVTIPAVAVLALLGGAVIYLVAEQQ